MEIITSTYDSLGNLLYEIKKTPAITGLVSVVCGYAIKEISSVNPSILNWDKWSKEKTHTIEFLGGFEQVCSFFSAAHSKLDHVEKYHLDTINQKLDFIIGKLKDWFVTFKNREYSSRFYGLADFRKPTRDKYPKIFKELKQLIESGVIKIPDWDKRTKRKIAKW